MARRLHLPATDQHLPDGMPTTTDEALCPNRRSSPPPLCCSFPACLPFSSQHGLVCRGVAIQVNFFHSALHLLDGSFNHFYIISSVTCVLQNRCLQ
ncbi:hypothetical protein ACQJBY_038355 [Aegilops geniculata]